MRYKVFLLFAIAGCLNLFYPIFLFSRNAPVTTAGSSAVCPGNIVTVPVTVTNFSSIKAITLRLDYDPTQLAFIDFSNINPAIASASVNYINVGTNLTKLMIVWAEVNAISLPDGSKLLDLNFTLTSGSPVVAFNNSDNGGGDCEYADENAAAMNDLPTETYYINATITNNTVAPAGIITGSNVVCAGAVNVAYSVPAIQNASGYLWSVPLGGTIISGNNSSSIMVNYSNSAVSGDVMVAGTNVCGQGMPSSLAIAINPLPNAAGGITGSDTVCASTNGVNYSIEAIVNATEYDWTVPAGAVITSGIGTNQIVVSFGTKPLTGTITAKGINACGSGAVSPDFVVTIVASQSAPVVTAAGPELTSSAVTGNQWYYEGTGAIAGATGQSYTAVITGWYWTVVKGVGCPTLESNHVYILFTGRDEIENNTFNVYPIPSTGRLYASMTSSSLEPITIQVYNQVGIKVFELDHVIFKGTIEQPIDLGIVPDGIYSVVFSGRNNRVVKKILISR